MTTEARHCPRCGAPLPGRPPTRCTACGYSLYVNPRPTGGVIIVRDGTFLALKRAREPGAGLWELPGGFCDGWEHPADAARREAREELGVDVVLGRFVGMYLGSYGFQDEVVPVLDMFWLATLASGELTIHSDEATDHAWFSLVRAPRLAFSTMESAISDAAACLDQRGGGN